jgi:hypothetical protein
MTKMPHIAEPDPDRTHRDAERGRRVNPPPPKGDIEDSSNKRHYGNKASGRREPAVNE